MSNKENDYINEYFLNGGGEAGAIIRSIDWTKTSLGHPSTWPQSLRISLGIILNSKFPMFIWWGPDLICFYNDAYRPSLGENGKHPAIMGMRGQEAWPEIWEIIKPLIDEVFAGGSTWSEDQLIPIYRNGKIEDVYWTFAYSPILEDDGTVGGVLVTCTETTDKIHILHSLENNKNELEFAIDAALLATWDYNPVTNKFKGNQRLKQWFGLTQDAEIDLQDAIDAVHEKDRERVMAAIRNALDYSSGGHYDIEYTIVNHITKKEIVVRAKGKSWFNDEKKAFRFNGTLEDVSEQALARNQVKSSEEKVRSLFSGSPFPIALYKGREMRIELANQAIIDIWGKGSDVIGKTYSEVLPELGEVFYNQLDSVYTTGQPLHFQNAFVPLRINGTLQDFYFNYSFTPVFDENGNVYGVMNTAANVTDLNLAKKKAEENEMRFRTMAEGSNVMIAMSDETSNATYFSKGWVELTGRPLEKLLQFGWADLLHPEDREKHLDVYLAAFKNKTPFTDEFRVLASTGEFRWLLASGNPLLGYDGNFFGFISSCIDITERKNSEQDVQENEFRFRTIIEEASVATALYIGPDINIQYANQLMFDSWGKDASILGKPMEEGIPELKGQPFIDILKNVYQTGEPYIGEEEYAELIVNGERQPFYFNFTYKALRDANGKIYGIHHMAVDATKEVKARQALMDSERKFRDNVKQAPVGIAILRGRDFIVEMANSNYLELIDREEKSFVGKPLFEGLPEVREVVEPLLLGVMDTGVAFFASDLSVSLNRYGNQELGYFNLVYQPLKEDDGNVYGVMVVATEVTELTKTKHALQESEKQFRSMVMQSPIPMAIFRGENHVIEMANREMFEKMWRKKEEDVVGKPVLEVFPELNDQKYPALLTSVYKSGITHTEKEAIAYVQGDDGMKKFYLDFEYSPLREPDGSISGIMITVNDVSTQVEAREKIQLSQSYFENMTDSVPTMIWITDKNGMCTYVNKRWAQYTGQKFEESLKHGWLIAIHPEDQKYAVMVFELSTKNNEAFTIEYRLSDAHGKYRWALVEAVPRFSTTGEFDGYIGTVVDIDDRKTIEEKIKESNQRSSLVIEAAELGTYEWVVGDTHATVSERFAQIFGLEKDGYVDRALMLSSFHPADLEVHRKAHELSETTDTLDYEARLIWSDKSIHWIKIRGRVITDPSGKRKMLGTVMDTTSIKKVSAALEVSEARLSEAQRIAGIGNWEYSYADKSFYCSEEVYRILSTSTESFSPSFYNLFRMIHPEDIKKLSRTLSFTRKTGLPFNLDFRIITDTDEIKFINSQGYMVVDENNKITRIIGTLQDISMRKLVEEELIEAKQITEKSLKFKEQFLANMSHEIRTPMNAIVGFTGLIQKTPLQPDQKQYIEAIKTSGENLLVIINDILDFSKVEAGAIHFENIDFKLSELVSTLTDLMLPKSVEKGIKLSVSIDPKVPDALVGDPTRLNQILINLVGNAIKFTEKGEVKINARFIAELENLVELQFSVSDTGIGIEPNMTNAIFDVFTQSSADTTRKYGGSGLGLAIVKQFVERQGGRVWVESELDKGSTFYFTLSFGISKQTDWEPKLPQEVALENNTESVKVLLVEDNKLNQLLASKALADWNWEVVIADNGLIALEKIAKEDFDVILMDIQLPEMDGYEATRYIRNTFDAPKSQTPIIAVTAHAMQSEIKKCKDAGMDGYITKPFSPKMLYEGIKNVIDTKKNISIEEE